MSVVLQIYAIIVTLSLIIVLSFYLLHRREVTRLSQKLQTLLHSFTHAELTLDFPSSDITDLVNALNECLPIECVFDNQHFCVTDCIYGYLNTIYFANECDMLHMFSITLQ